jgi:hypothetical protein
MYPWDSRADGPRTRPQPDPATLAVQVALDRRDNGGDTTATAATATAADTAAAAATDVTATAGHPRQ